MLVDNSSTDSVSEECVMAEFESTYLDSMLDIYDSLQESFKYNPQFLQFMTSTDLTGFIMDCYFDYQDLKVYDFENNTFDYYAKQRFF